jgi:transposase-like protein
MALSQSVASELLEAFRAGEGVDLVRESVRLVMQELIETEASERIGADRYERTETRITDRNGSRPRLLATQAGDVQLRIPKLRKGSFFPVILEPRRRIEVPRRHLPARPPHRRWRAGDQHGRRHRHRSYRHRRAGSPGRRCRRLRR